MRSIVAAMLIGGLVAPARGDDLTRARAFFEAGVDAYDAGQYETALRDFQQSHAMSHSPALYFNMAACEEHLNHYQAAALLLRQYLIEKPDAEDQAKVQARIKVLEERDDAMKRPEEPTVPIARLPASPPAATQAVAAPVAKAPARPRRVISWALVGVTGALVVGAVAAGSYAIVDHGDLKSGCGMTPAGCSPGAIGGMRAAQYATDALIGVAAAAAVATVVMFIVEPRLHRSRERASIRVTPAGVIF